MAALRVLHWALLLCGGRSELVYEEDTRLYIGSLKDDEFGNAVSISGDYAVVASQYENSTGEHAGAVYIFSRSGSWLQEARLSAEAAGDTFGASVDVAGNILVVGAPLHDFGGLSDMGSAYIFRRSDNGSWVQEAKLIGEDSRAGDKFGASIAISEDSSEIVVGADWHGGPGLAGSGAAYVFSYDGTSWRQTAKLVARDGEEFDRFGGAVDISGATAIVGAYDEDGHGAAYLFERNSTGWFEMVKYQAEFNASETDKFGSAVAVSDNVAVVGAYWDDELAINAGAAFIYTRHGSTWDEGVKILAPGGSQEERFGISVDISGNMVIIGSNFDSDDGTWSGAAFVYTESSQNVWSLKDKLSWANASSAEFFGRSVSIWDSRVGPYTCLVGAPGANSSFFFEGDIPTTTTSTTATMTATSTTSTTFTSTMSTSSVTSTSSTTTTETKTFSSTSTNTFTLTTATRTSSTATTETVTSSTKTQTTRTSSTATMTTKTTTSSTITTRTTTSETQTTSTATSVTQTDTTMTTTSNTNTRFLAPPGSQDDEETSDKDDALMASPTAVLLLAIMAQKSFA